MDLGLAGKTVIVTGGASNIGRAISLTFAREGANVVIAELDEPQAKKVANEAKGKAMPVKMDITDWGQVQDVFKKVRDKFGAIDILVNNAAWERDALFVEKPMEDIEKEIKVNYLGMINCTRAVLSHMIERRAGNVVSIGSDAGRMGEYREGVYAGTKAAIIALSKTLARENGRYGLRFNVVCPGLTLPEKDEDIGEMSLWKGPAAALYATPEAREKAAKAYPLRKVGKPQDVAYAVVFLASDICAGHITGQTLSVSGGYTMI